MPLILLNTCNHCIQNKQANLIGLGGRAFNPESCIRASSLLSLWIYNPWDCLAA